MKKLALAAGMLLVFGSSRVGMTKALFTDAGQTTGTFSAAADWHAPISSASALSTYQTGTTFTVHYAATDGETGIAGVVLYSRKGTGGVFSLYATDQYSGQAAVSGGFTFTAVEGDGTYQFYTVSTDVYGNIESAPGTSDASTILDTVAPTTVLSASSGIVVGENVENGDFESGLSSGWNWNGKVERITGDSLDTDGDAAADIVIGPPSGSGSMARVGHREDFSGQLTSGNSVWNNKLTQIIDRENQYLSFYWRVVSFDMSDNPAAAVTANDTEVLRVTGSELPAGYPGDSGWQRSFIDLSGFSDDKIEVKFYAGNTDGANFSQSWIYIDDVTTGRPAMTPASNVLLTASDANGAASITYSLDDGGSWTTAPGELVSIPGSSLSAGLNYVKYYATDNPGNIETIPAHSTEVIVDDNAPGSPIWLSSIGISEHEIDVSWIAPGDIGYFARAAAYLMRVSATLLTPANFSATGAAVPNVPAPAADGETQAFTISGLAAGTPYWIGISACDPVHNCSDPAIETAATVSEHTADPGDVVINELMWMGMNGITGDEWLELRNMTDQDIDLSNWQLTKKRTTDGAEVSMFFLPSGTTISAHGYLLISEFDQDHSALNVASDLIAGTGADNSADFSLANDNLQIRLYDSDFSATGLLIDTADDGIGSPMAGLADLDGTPVYDSMERNATPGDGTQAGSWHTTFADTSAFFDAGSAAVKGTPGAANQSQEFLVLPTAALTIDGSETASLSGVEPVATASGEIQ